MGATLEARTAATSWLLSALWRRRAGEEQSAGLAVWRDVDASNGRGGSGFGASGGGGVVDVGSWVAAALVSGAGGEDSALDCGGTGDVVELILQKLPEDTAW